MGWGKEVGEWDGGGREVGDGDGEGVKVSGNGGGRWASRMGEGGG